MSLVSKALDMASSESIGNALIKHFNDCDIRIRQVDGYVHATDMCKVGKKEWSGYMRSKRTKEFIIELESEVGIESGKLIQNIVTGINESRGTWVHPHIATHLAQWISPIFAGNINERVRKIKEEYGENIHRTYTIRQPNATAFWKLIKRKLQHNINKAKKSNWFSLKNMTLIEFKKTLNSMDKERIRKE
jgi:hypothetical protein